jgi:hypothetical protein
MAIFSYVIKVCFSGFFQTPKMSRRKKAQIYRAAQVIKAGKAVAERQATIVHGNCSNVSQIMMLQTCHHIWFGLVGSTY